MNKNIKERIINIFKTEKKISQFFFFLGIWILIIGIITTVINYGYNHSDEKSAYIEMDEKSAYIEMLAAKAEAEKERYDMKNMINLNFIIIGKTTKKEIIEHLGSDYSSTIVPIGNNYSSGTKEFMMYRTKDFFHNPKLTITIENNIVTYYQKLN